MVIFALYIHLYSFVDEMMAVESRGDMEDEEEWHPLYGSKEYTEDELQQYRKQAHNLTI